MGYKFNPLIYTGLDLVGSGGGGAPFFMPPVPTEADLPTPGTNGELRVVLNTDHVYVYNGSTGLWRDTGLTEAQAYGTTPNDIGYDLEVEIQGGIERNTLVLQPADATHPGGVSITDQEFSGVKTFIDGINPGNGSNSLKFLGTNAAGEIASIDSWSVDPALGMLNSYVQYAPPVDAGPQYPNIQRFELDINPLQNTADDNITLFDLNSHYDRNNNGFDHTGYYRALTVTAGHEGTGELGEQKGVSLNLYSNNGGNTQDYAGIDLYMNTTNGSTFDSGYGIRNNFNGVGGGSSGSFDSYTATVTGDFNSYINLSNIYWDGTTSQNVNGSTITASSTSTGSFITPYNANIDGTYGGLTLFNGSFNGTISGGGYGAGLNIFTQNTVTAEGFTGVNVSLRGTFVQSIAGVAVNTDTAVVGTGQRAYTYTGNGGGVNINSLFTPQSGMFFEQGNVMTSFMTVNSGSPLTGTDVINQNLSSLIFAQDDINIGPLGLGVVGVGFVGQVAIASTKTVDKVSMSLGGAGVPVQATGGAVVDLSIYDAVGILSQGGTITATNLYGFRVGDNFTGGMATNAWGIYVEDAAIGNYFAGIIETDTAIQINDPGVGNNSVTIQSPTLGSSYTLTLPPDDGAPGQFLQTDGSGVLSWIAAGSTGDITETDFSGTQSVAVPADVTGFFFGATVKSFDAQVNVTVNATSSLYEHFKLTGVNKGGTWVLYAQSFGDDTDVDFFINAGQIQYTSSTYSGFSALNIDFRALTLNT